MAVNLKTLPEMLRFHRKRSGLTQAQLALFAGVGKTVVFDVEHGKSSIQIDTLSKILKALNISWNLNSPLMDEFEREQDEIR
ncbi:MAG: helix-turn-helix domain-containing protein [Myxococcaceae bacterium]